MSTENTSETNAVNDEVTESVIDDSDDLDAFSAEFFGQNEAQPEQASSEEVKVEAKPDDASEEDTLPDDDAVEDDNDETDETPKEGPKKKNRFQERIDELTGKQRDAERRAQTLEQRLADAISKLEQQEPKPTPVAIKEATGPAPDDLSEDGTDRYPLGEFDPSYIRDLTKFTLEQERKNMQEEAKRQAEQSKVEQAKAELNTIWSEKLIPAKERYPDFEEKGQQLVSTFDSIDEKYGEYLSATIKSMEYGPDVLYYLSNHPDEAHKIVMSGPVSATISLGRLESKFAAAEEEKQTKRPRVSNAPTPPAQINKGSAAAMPDVPDDTDDLDLFTAKLFPKKKR